jgi:hypothetical protein
MTLHARVVLVVMALAAAACGSSSTPAAPAQPTPSSPAATTASVALVYRAQTARRGELISQFESCVLAVGATHTHPSWLDYAAVTLTPVPPDRFEVVMNGVPVGTTHLFRVNDGNACDQNPTGAVARGVFLNGVELTQNATTPGPEPGFSFSVAANGRVTQ